MKHFHVEGDIGKRARVSDGLGTIVQKEIFGFCFGGRESLKQNYRYRGDMESEPRLPNVNCKKEKTHLNDESLLIDANHDGRRST